MPRLITLGRFQLLDSEVSGGQPTIQPKRLALLAWLAIARPRGPRRRDALLAMFWPELDQERARRALRQALHHLRQTLGEHAIVRHGDDQVELADDAIDCDAVEFERLAKVGDDQGALQLYAGPFLDAVFVAGAAPEFEGWLSDMRARLHALAVAAARRITEREEAAGRLEAAAAAASRTCALAPDDEAALRHLLRLFERQGDHVGAIARYDSFAQHLKREYGTTPAAETSALVQRTFLVPSQAPIVPPASAPASITPEGRPSWWAPAGRWIVAALVIGVTGMALGLRRSRSPLPVWAVGLITELGGVDSSMAAQVLPDLITTALARSPQLRVVSHARLFEVAGDLGMHTISASALSRAAHQAGATDLLQGTLRHGDGDSLVLELQLVRLPDGRVQDVISVSGTDAYALARLGANAMLPALGGLPAHPGLDGDAVSLLARRLYEEGLRAYYLGDVSGASRLLAAAVAEDSGFALASFRLGGLLISTTPDADGGLRLLKRAAARSGRLPEVDQLGIKAGWMSLSNDPRTLFVAESLSSRFPGDPAGQLLYGAALIQAGRFLQAIAPLRRAVVLDSLSLSGQGVACRACDGFASLIAAYLHADSAAAAERVAREWIAARPGSPWSWRNLAVVASRNGRFTEAESALRRASAIEPGARGLAISHASVAVRVDSLSLAERLLRRQLREATSPEAAANARWWLGITLRAEGRMREALTLALDEVQLTPPLPRHDEIRSQAITARLMGNNRIAAQLFDSIGRAAASGDSIAPGTGARHRALSFTLVGDAIAALGDTVRLARLADSVEAAGRQSGYARDQRLHWHLRGLLAEAEGRPDEALGDFRRAVYSPSEGYTRTNVELARLYLGTGRPGEAILTLQSALHGPTDAGNVYVTRTELHEWLAQAFEAAGVRDSAAAHYQTVARGWSAGDAPYRARARAAAARARALSGGAGNRAGHREVGNEVPVLSS